MTTKERTQAYFFPDQYEEDQRKKQLIERKKSVREQFLQQSRVHRRAYSTQKAAFEKKQQTRATPEELEGLRNQLAELQERAQIHEENFGSAFLMGNEENAQKEETDIQNEQKKEIWRKLEEDRFKTALEKERLKNPEIGKEILRRRFQNSKSSYNTKKEEDLADFRRTRLKQAETSKTQKLNEREGYEDLFKPKMKTADFFKHFLSCRNWDNSNE